MGSSPLARGTPGASCHADALFGLIPARAGNTLGGRGGLGAMRAHPRSRGGHPIPAPPGTSLSGSSPLARGTQEQTARLTVEPGLIPARAGNTLEQVRVPATRGAHPRSRGEHARYTPGRSLSPGSSPLARGTRPRLRSVRQWPGLIPARAGNTRRTVERLILARAHPRSRGEHTFVLSSFGREWGSSPLARGTRLALHLCGSYQGLIPARAGNTQ